MPFKKLLDEIISAISTLGRTTAAQRAIVELEKQSPSIAKAIRDGLSISDALSQAQSLQKETQRAMRVIPNSKEDAVIVTSLGTELEQAQKAYKKAKAKATGRVYSKLSKSKRAKIQSDIKIAKAIVNELQSQKDDAIDDFMRSTGILGRNATSILSKHKKLQNTIKASKAKTAKKTTRTRKTRTTRSSRTRTRSKSRKTRKRSRR